MSSPVSVDDITKISYRFVVKWNTSVQALIAMSYSNGGPAFLSNHYKFKNIENFEFSFRLLYGKHFIITVQCKTDMPMFQEDALIIIKDRIYRMECTPTNTVGRLILNRDVLTENTFEDDQVTIHCVMSIPAQIKAVIVNPKEDKNAPSIVECESIVTYPKFYPYDYDTVNQFVYSGSCPDFSVETAINMIGNAHKRQNPMLKALSIEFLMENITAENVAEVMKQAVEFEVPDLIRKCADFLSKKCKILPIDDLFE